MAGLTSIIPKIILKSSKAPMHIAVQTGSVKSWAEKNKADLKESIDKHIQNLSMLIDLQLKNQNQVLSINLKDDNSDVLKELKSFFRGLLEDKRIHENKMRVFFVGQWYEMDSELIEIFKDLMEKTKDYDQYFVNFCVNYDGQEEILGSIRLVVRKILAEKMNEADLSVESVKENLYTSYFPPPQLIIETGCQYSGMLLWDSKGSVVYYTYKPWMAFEKKFFDEAINFYAKGVCQEEDK